MVTSLTPALSAMALVVVPSKPLSANRAKAAADILSLEPLPGARTSSSSLGINMASNYLHTYSFATPQILNKIKKFCDRRYFRLR